jgi:hypothetical protein
MDDVFVKINGELYYLWRAVGHEGEILECYVSKRRNEAAALKLLKKAMRKHGAPNKIATDKLRSYGSGCLRNNACNLCSLGTARHTVIIGCVICRHDDASCLSHSLTPIIFLSHEGLHLERYFAKVIMPSAAKEPSQPIKHFKIIGNCRNHSRSARDFGYL